jgi:membrane protein
VSKVRTVPDDAGEPGSVEPPGRQSSRWKRYEATVREKAESVTAAAEARRDDSRLYDAVFLVYERNRLLPASLLVGALASRIVIYLIPFLAMLIFALGLYEDAGGAGTAAASSIADIFAQAVADSADASQGFRLAALIATTLAVVYAANSLGRLVRRSTALVWGVPYRRASRPWTTPAGVLALSAVGMLVSSLGSWSQDWTLELLIGVLTVEFVFLVVLWLFVSWKLPHDPAATRWSDFLPGAIVLAVGVVGLRVGMVVYFVPHSADLAQRYGSIGVALVMLTWAYWLWMIIIGGSEINAALLRSAKEKGRR